MHKLILFLSIAIFLLASCSSPIPPNQSLTQSNLTPNEQFFMDRFSPKDFDDLEVYFNVLNDIKDRLELREGPLGFNHEWTVQGPGNLGGRVNSIAVDKTNTDRMYIGFSLGGIWKTEDGGGSWRPVFDDQIVSAIGDISIDPNDPSIVYVGTGDLNITGTPFIGNGLYKSIDYGENWERVGLEKSGIISKIVVAPNSTTIFAGVMGVPFYKNEDKGLYKSEDGGSTWEKILYLNDSTGIIDVVINPTNPDIILAAGWNRIRNNQISIISGNETALYKSEDRGLTWKELTVDLPSTPNVRIGLESMENYPGMFFTVFIDDDGPCGSRRLRGVYKTTDNGESWEEIPTQGPDGLDCDIMGGFGWYFGQIRVNPTDPNEIYITAIELWKTSNSGASWERASPPWWSYAVHADQHDMVFVDKDNVVLGNDGGLYRGDIRNEIWNDLEDIPTNQFYRVAVNPHLDGIYYGGMQDNGTAGGRVDNINAWPRIFGGDGFQPAFDPENDQVHYATTQNGAIWGSTNGGRNFDRLNDPIIGKSANWDVPWIISGLDARILYYGSDRLVRGFYDSGFATWEEVSPPLVGSGPFNSSRKSLFAIAESPINPDIIYTGATDGSVFRTTDYSTTWENITAGLPANLVSSIKASPSEENKVYITHTGYRDGDNSAKIHRSDDNGDTWEDISSDLPDNMSINDIIIIPAQRDSMLFIATDGGIFGSIDAANSWHKVGKNMPIIPTFDMEFSPNTREIVAGTFGRSIMTYSIDSLLRGIIVNTAEIGKISPELSISPIPAMDNIVLSIKGLDNQNDIEYVILSMEGKVTNSGKLLNNQRDLDISSMQSGSYVIKLKIGKKIVSQMFTKI